MPRVLTTTEIRVSPEWLFAYVTTPANWPRWHLNSRGVTGATDHSLQVGEQVTEEFSIAGWRGVITWTVTERVEPSRWAISGRVTGGGDGTITYSIAPGPGAGVASYQREFVYGMPNALLALLDRLVLRSRIEADARASVQRLKGVLEARQ